MKAGLHSWNNVLSDHRNISGMRAISDMNSSLHNLRREGLAGLDFDEHLLFPLYVVVLRRVTMTKE